jgi:hypothetical protein
MNAAMNPRQSKAETRFVIFMAILIAIIVGFALYSYFAGWPDLGSS